MFEQLLGRHFPSEIPATEKKRNPTNVLSIIRKIIVKKVDINVEIVRKSHDLAHHLVLCYTIMQLIIVKIKRIFYKYN